MTDVAEMERAVVNMMVEKAKNNLLMDNPVLVMSEATYFLIDDPENVKDARIAGVPIAFSGSAPVGLMFLTQTPKVPGFDALGKPLSSYGAVRNPVWWKRLFK